MLRRSLIPVWTGILVLSGMFLVGQETWPPDFYRFIYCEDNDSDGYGIRPALLCPYVLPDCDDTNPDINPGAPELCNGIDDNCDSVIDDADQDQDGYIAAVPPCGGDDCDDLNPNVYPGATELCDGLDNDCDGTTPAEEADDDADGYVECSPWVGIHPAILGGSDCDDTQPTVNPGMTEAAHGDPICADGLDNDCDELTDLADNGCQECSTAQDCDDGNVCTDDACVNYGCSYTDNTNTCDDGDPCTVGDVCSQGVCSPGPLRDDDGDGYVVDTCGGNDCDDTNPDVHPGAQEICNGIDDNCDSNIDDVDQDQDGHVTDTPPCGGDDCDDTNSSIYPGAIELCDGIDNDCDGVVPADEVDNDGDGYVECSPWTGTDPGITGGGDCNDTQANVNPGVTEGPPSDPMCADTVDNDCDGLTDSNDPGCQ